MGLRASALATTLDSADIQLLSENSVGQNQGLSQENRGDPDFPYFPIRLLKNGDLLIPLFFIENPFIRLQLAGSPIF